MNRNEGVTSSNFNSKLIFDMSWISLLFIFVFQVSLLGHDHSIKKITWK